MASTYRSTSANTSTADRLHNFMRGVPSSFGKNSVAFQLGLASQQFHSITTQASPDVVSSAVSRLSFASRANRATLATICLQDLISSHLQGTISPMILDTLAAPRTDPIMTFGYILGQVLAVQRAPGSMRNELSVTGQGVSIGTFLFERKDEATLKFEKALRAGRKGEARPEKKSGGFEYVVTQDIHPEDLSRFFYPGLIDEAQLAGNLGLEWFTAAPAIPYKTGKKPTISSAVQEMADEGEVEVMIGF